MQVSGSLLPGASQVTTVLPSLNGVLLLPERARPAMTDFLAPDPNDTEYHLYTDEASDTSSVTTDTPLEETNDTNQANENTPENPTQRPRRNLIGRIFRALRPRQHPSALPHYSTPAPTRGADPLLPAPAGSDDNMHRYFALLRGDHVRLHPALWTAGDLIYRAHRRRQALTATFRSYWVAAMENPPSYGASVRTNGPVLWPVLPPRLALRVRDELACIVHALGNVEELFGVCETELKELGREGYLQRDAGPSHRLHVWMKFRGAVEQMASALPVRLDNLELMVDEVKEIWRRETL